MKTEEIYANALNLLPELGPVRLEQLRRNFGSFQAAWEAKTSDYAQAVGAGPVEAISRAKQKIDPELEWKRLLSRGIRIILAGQEQYPPLLSEIYAPPALIYVRGQLEILCRPSLSVVGTRKISSYGIRAAEEIAGGLARQGLVVVSGLAYGVDSQALSACLDAGGSAVAVLPGAIDDQSISPRAHINLARRIQASGCLISEHGLGSQVQKFNFPVRNRIISGLSLGTVVIEAAVQSGSLITASLALEQNREVFAVPGPIFSETSSGPNDLITRGAKCVTGWTDILRELNLDLAPDQKPAGLVPATAQETLILSALTGNGSSRDDLVRTLRLSVAAVNGILSMLELKGRVKKLNTGNYVKIR